MSNQETKKEMTLAIALETLMEIDNHELRMRLVDVMADLSKSQFNKGMSLGEDIWRPKI